MPDSSSVTCDLVTASRSCHSDWAGGQTNKRMTSTELDQEAERATALLAGKVVKRVWRHRVDEVGIEFADGTRVFVHSRPDAVELSITGSQDPEAATPPIEPPELSPTVLLIPADGWHAFQSSSALSALLWKSLACWHYLNFTSDTSTWECPQHGTLAWLAFDNGEVISEFGVRFPPKSEHSDCSIHRIVEQLHAVYGLEASR